MYVSRAQNFHIHPTTKTLHPHLLNQKLEPPAGIIPFADGGFTLHLVLSLFVNLPIFIAFTHSLFK
jgi:hypothetical protein